MTRSTRILLSMLLAGVTGVFPFATTAAAEERRQCNNITITSDQHFNPANGVQKGTGSQRDPFVISGCSVNSVTIKDTSAAVLLTNNTINRLVLDWIGGNVTAVENDIGDLRVNQNVKRTGEPTSGLIARNTFGIVGQLRHFDGVFENNVVTGQRPAGTIQIPFFENGQSVNFDGFNGSRFRNNEITGFVTMRLHGHHHSSSFGEGSHYHGADPAAHAGEMVDHTQRYHRVYFTGNTITSPGPYALNYVDTAHAANDRTAASETNEELNKPHVHFTKVQMNSNYLIGSGLYVNIFNADDERHLETRTGSLQIRNNRIDLVQESGRKPFFTSEEPAGISIYKAKDVHVEITGNTVTNKDERTAVEQTQMPFMTQPKISGVKLYYIDLAQIHLMNNSVSSTDYGISAAEMPETVEWWIHDLTTEAVGTPVYWDNTVVNQPHRD